MPPRALRWRALFLITAVTGAPHDLPFTRTQGGSFPVPRTLDARLSPRVFTKWRFAHAVLVRDAKRAHNASLILLGDSITEALRGTLLGVPSSFRALAASALRSELGDEWPRPLVLAIAGDETQHLLWRIQNGELPPHLRTSGAPISVLIGTNNLLRGRGAAHAVGGILTVVNWLLANTRSPVLVSEILPFGDTERARAACPPICLPGGQAHPYAPSVSTSNEMLRREVAQLQQRSATHRARVTLVSCGHLLLTSAGTVDPVLVPDFTHPTAEAHRRLLHCLRPYLRAATKKGGAGHAGPTPANGDGGSGRRLGLGPDRPDRPRPITPTQSTAGY